MGNWVCLWKYKLVFRIRCRFSFRFSNCTIRMKWEWKRWNIAKEKIFASHEGLSVSLFGAFYSSRYAIVDYTKEWKQ